jgi:hypothetical protein
VSHIIGTNNVGEDIAKAIDRSISHNEIAHLDVSSVGLLADAYEEQLARECEGSADRRDEGVVEYWGVDLDGEEWRVHLEVRHDRP